MNPVNILHIMTRLPVGGVENQLLTVLRKYERNRYAPVVCSLSDRGEIGKEMEERGVEVICLNKLKHKFDWTIIKDIYRLIKDRDIKIVRTHQYHANFYGRIAAVLARVPCIIPSVHNLYNRDKKLHRRMINRVLGGLSDRIVAVSNSVKENIIRYDHINEKKIVVINNGIDKELYNGHDRREIRKALGMLPEENVVGTVGRLKRQKGQKYLIEAIAHLKGKYPAIKLIIIGDGPLKNTLQDYAISLGISDNVKFMGTRRDVPALLSAIDIFVLPSLREGLVNALLEAMAAGKPVIASDIKPIREIVDSNNIGKLIPIGDSRKLATSIEELLKNYTVMEKMGKAARERAISVFSIESTVSDYTRLYEDILRSKGWNI